MSKYDDIGPARHGGNGGRQKQVERFVLRTINTLVLIVAVALTWRAGEGTLSGEPMSLIASRYSSYFLPANYVFRVWGLLYAGFVAGCMYQLLPTEAGRRAVDRLGAWWAIGGTLNIGWVLAFSFGYYNVALGLMGALLLALVQLSERVRQGYPYTFLDAALITWPVDGYMAWVSAGLITNVFQVAKVTAWSGFGVGESTWAAGMLIACAFLSGMLAWSRGMWPFAVVMAWVLRGISVRHPGIPVVAVTANVASVLSVAGGAIGWWNYRAPARR